jgi:hypothetical protein
VFNVTCYNGTEMRQNVEYGLRIESGAANINLNCTIWYNVRGAIRLVKVSDIRINGSVLTQNSPSGFLLHARDSWDILITNSTQRGPGGGR